MPFFYTIFTSLFDETNANAKWLYITDVTPYALAGVSSGDILGYAKVDLTTSDGTTTVYDNIGGSTPDLVRAVGDVSNRIPLPVDSDGNILKGTYTIRYVGVDSTGVHADFDQSYTVDYLTASPKIMSNLVIDCGNSRITSKDVTNYGTGYVSFTRQHKLYPPTTLSMSPYSTTTDTLVVTSIYTQTWAVEIITELVYDTISTLPFTRRISGVREFTVDCDTNLCKILCCLTNIKRTYDGLVNKNPTQAQYYKETIIEPTMENMVLFHEAQACGDVNKQARFKAAILDITDCGSDCGCPDADSDIPTQVLATSAVDFISVVDSPDNSITVTSSVSGNTTVYHTQVSAAIQNILSSVHDTTVSTATPATIQINTTGTDPRNYEINYIGAAPISSKQMEVQIYAFLNPDATSPYALLAPLYLKLEGSAWKASNVHSWAIGTSQPNDDTMTSLISVSNILTSGSYTNITAHAQAMGRGVNAGETLSKKFDVEVFYFSEAGAGQVTLRVLDETGAPYNLFDLFRQASPGFYISLTIYYN